MKITTIYCEVREDKVPQIVDELFKDRAMFVRGLVDYNELDFTEDEKDIPYFYCETMWPGRSLRLVGTNLVCNFNHRPSIEFATWILQMLHRLDAIVYKPMSIDTLTLFFQESKEPVKFEFPDELKGLLVVLERDCKKLN